MTNDDSLIEALRRAAEAPAPAGFKPGMTFDGRSPKEIVTPPLPKMESAEEFEEAVRGLGYPLPPDMTLILVEMQFVQHESFWKRDPEHRGEKDTAYTAPSASWRYRFKVVPKSLREDEDIALLMAEAKAAEPAPRTPRGMSSVESLDSKVVSLADFQWGKTDELGGSAETLARSEAALAAVVMDLIANPVTEFVLVDPGDSIEGFESAPNAAQMNDLHLTEQVRIWRRVLWRWISEIAPLVDNLVVIGVPSNHCRVRRGKNALGSALDDWGIDTIASVSDIASANLAAYGHVRFIVPNEHEEHVLFTLVGGKVLGVVHGHQKGSAAALPGWIKSTGRRGLSQADIIICGHFHHLEIVAFGDQQFLIVSPTNDNGSSWFTPSSGERSEPGVLTVRIDSRGWHSLDVIWLGDIGSRS